MYEDGTSHELASLHPVVKRNPALAMSSGERMLVQESPTLSLEELLTAAHDIMHGLTELLTPIHGMAASAHGRERMAGEVANVEGEGEGEGEGNVASRRNDDGLARAQLLGSAVSAIPTEPCMLTTVPAPAEAT
jgi:hypothetical protein